MEDEVCYKGIRSKLDVKLSRVGSTAKTATFKGEIQSEFQFKPKGGYLEEGGACCLKCKCGNFTVGKKRGTCEFFGFGVGENGICRRYIKQKDK